MSQESSASEAQESKEVYVTDTDIQHIEKFFEHFKIPVPADLTEAIATFKDDRNFVNQDKLRLQVALATVAMRGHNPLIDEAFGPVMESAGKKAYDMQFKKDLEEVIGVDPSLPNPENS